MISCRVCSPLRTSCSFEFELAPTIILDETDRSQVAINATATTRLSLPPLKPSHRPDHVETQVVERQRLASSVEVIVMFVDHAQPIPFPESAPVQRAGFTGHTDKIECPGRMYLVRSIARNRGLFNGYR